jgi:cardiolipin synthase
MGASSFPLTCFERDKDVSSDGHAQNRHYSNERRNKIKFNYHINHRCFVSSSSNSKKGSTTRSNEEQDGRTRSSGKGKKTVNTQTILEQMRSIPNLITMSRIVSAPGLAALIVMDQYEWALGGVVIFGFTDWLDGYLARNYNMKTVLGTYLDPLADKIMVNTLALSLCYQDLLPMPLVGLWLGRDVALCIGTYYFNSKMTKSGESVIDPARTPLEIEPSFTSKVNTVLQFVTLAAAMTEPLSGLSHDIVIKLCWLTAGTTAASGLSYIDGKSMITSGNFRLKGGLGGTTKPDHKKTPQNSIEKKEGPR